MTLYEIGADYRDLMEAIEAAETDEEREAATQALMETGGNLVEKAENYARIIRNVEAEAKALRDEEKRLADKRRSRENLIERLKGRIQDVMMLDDLREIRTGIGKFTIVRNPLHVDVVNIDEVPEEWHVPQPDTINKRALLDWYKKTEEIIPGCEFGYGYGLRFK